MTAAGDGYRLAICNGSLSSSDSMLQPRLNEGSVITVTACCAWKPAFLGLNPYHTVVSVRDYGTR